MIGNEPKLNQLDNRVLHLLAHVAFATANIEGGYDSVAGFDVLDRWADLIHDAHDCDSSGQLTERQMGGSLPTFVPEDVSLLELDDGAMQKMHVAAA